MFRSPIRDLGAAYRKHGDRKNANAEFELEIVTGDKRRRWITVDQFAMGPETKWFPKWQKTVPRQMRFRFNSTVEGK